MRISTGWKIKKGAYKIITNNVELQSMKKISLQTFLYHFSNNHRKDKKYCFILGAGASKQSGIPTGAELVKEWMNQLT